MPIWLTLFLERVNPNWIFRVNLNNPISVVHTPRAYPLSPSLPQDANAYMAYSRDGFLGYMTTTT